MFENLLYIYSKDNGFFDRYTKENESRELKKMKDELLKKDTELKILQRRYNKLLNNCIQIELNKKVKKDKKIMSDISDISNKREDQEETHEQDDNNSIDEYEKV